MEWLLLTTVPVAGLVDAVERVQWYARRWGIECSFRDTKDPHFGMGMGQIRISSPERRDRLWLLNALAVALLTLLGAAGEALGFDKHLKASIVLSLLKT